MDDERGCKDAARFAGFSRLSPLRHRSPFNGFPSLCERILVAAHLCIIPPRLGLRSYLVQKRGAPNFFSVETIATERVSSQPFASERLSSPEDQVVGKMKAFEEEEEFERQAQTGQNE